MSPRRPMLQNLHLMGPGARARRLCGSTTGAYARTRERAWIKKFLRDGGQICPECAKATSLASEDVPVKEEPKRRRTA